MGINNGWIDSLDVLMRSVFKVRHLRILPFKKYSLDPAEVEIGHYQAKTRVLRHSASEQCID